MAVKSALGRTAVVALFILSLSVAAFADTRTDRLIELLETSSSYRVRAQSALSLGRLGGEQAVQALIVALDDENDLVRTTAAHSLGRIGTPEARRALERVSMDPSQPDVVANQVIESLQRIQLLARR